MVVMIIEMENSTYAPQSPDLSGFRDNSNSNPSPAKPLPPAHSSVPASYAPRSPNLQPFANFSSPQQAPQHPRNLGPFGGAYQPPRSYPAYDDILHGQSQAYPSIPSLPPSHNFDTQQQQQQQQQPQFYAPPPSYPQQSDGFPGYKNEPVADYRLDVPAYGAAPHQQQFSHSIVHDDMTGRVKRERGAGDGARSANGVPDSRGPSMGIDVKTKFPVARIKRIMQADEEVGKVAQVTPVAVSKALELFMISLVTKSADLARAGNSKRVTAQHLKKAIEADEQFDFLNDIISKVVEGPEAGGKRVKDDDDSEDEEEKKPKKSRGRKKKE